MLHYACDSCTKEEAAARGGWRGTAKTVQKISGLILRALRNKGQEIGESACYMDCGLIIRESVNTIKEKSEGKD